MLALEIESAGALLPFYPTPSTTIVVKLYLINPHDAPDSFRC